MANLGQRVTKHPGEKTVLKMTSTALVPSNSASFQQLVHSLFWQLLLRQFAVASEAPIMESLKTVDVKDINALKHYFKRKGTKVSGTFTAKVKEPARSFVAKYLQVVTEENYSFVFGMEDPDALINYIFLGVNEGPASNPVEKDFEIKPENLRESYAYLSIESIAGYATSGKIEKAWLGDAHFKAENFHFVGEGQQGRPYEVESGAFDVEDVHK